MLLNFTELSPCFQRDIHFEFLAIALDDNYDYVTGLFGTERIREVVKILNRFAVKSNHQIARFQSSLRGRAVRANIREQDALKIVAEIGNRSEIRAVAAATA